MKTATRSTSRRHVLKGAAALAATGLAGLPTGAAAQAKGKIVIGTWGGDYARLLNKNIDQPILIKEGWEVIQDQAGDPERRSKMLAERRLPRGTTDIQGLSALNMFQMHDAGVIDMIEYGKLRNAPNLLASMKYPYGVGHIYSGKVGV
jgi:putative spermidine/putrescine transport system substrate-binding protein